MKATQEGKLLRYMMGWKKGVAGLAFDKHEMDDSDFRSGWTKGREQNKSEYIWASAYYGAQLNPIRLQPSESHRFTIIGTFKGLCETTLGSAMTESKANEMVEAFKKWPAVEANSLKIVEVCKE